MNRRDFVSNLIIAGSAIRLGAANVAKTDHTPEKKNKNPVSAKSKTGKTITVPSRQVPVIAETDVLVIGGGPAGTAAAIAASRTGAETWLVERYNHLGGLWTGGLVLPLLSTHAVDKNKSGRLDIKKLKNLLLERGAWLG